MGMWNDPSPLTDAVARTESEIMAYAVSDEDNIVEPESLPNFRHDAEDADDDLEQTEGWDGSPLPLEEIAETNIEGHSPTGYDRPLALDLEQQFDRGIAQRDQAIAQLQQQNQHLQMLADPNYKTQQDQADDALLTAVLDSPSAVRGHIDALRGHIHQMQSDRVNASLGAAHRDHGRAFERAYRDMTSMNTNDPAARALVQDVWNHRDPGVRLMELAGRGAGQAFGGGSRLPPSLNSGQSARWSDGQSMHGRRPAASSSRDSGWPVGDEDDGVDSMAEREIWGDMWR
jgi:hypothetical protein